MKQGLKHCITDIFTALNKTLAHVAKHKGPKFGAIDERSCKIHTEEAKCLKEYEENCLNIETFAKVYGKQNGYNFLMFYYLYESACQHNIEITEEDKKCDREVFHKNLCPREGDKCELLKNYIECLNNELLEKCKNKEFAEFRHNSEIYALQKVFPDCEV
uniref:Uncharacterized protein n=1 Tax=Panagrolaimus davidi TaxID=227884 RepID=A0A914QAQ3_9BILA